MGRSYDTGIAVRTCAYIRRPFWHPVNNTAAQGRGQVTAFVQKLNLAAQAQFQFRTTSARYTPRSSKIDIKILHSATVREVLSFCIPRNLLPSFRCFFAPSSWKRKRGPVRMPTVSSRSSNFGMNCFKCSHELIAPERSQYWSEWDIRHHWHCPKCNSCFETITDTKSLKAVVTRNEIFRSLPLA